MIRYTRGVNRILGNAEGPQPISEIIIQTLMERTNSDGLLEQELLYRKGDEIIVKRGILKDLVGIVEKNLSDEGRVKILFKWLQGTFRAEVPYHDLEKVA
jgi:transcription antitermination factor NusG